MNRALRFSVWGPARRHSGRRNIVATRTLKPPSLFYEMNCIAQIEILLQELKAQPTKYNPHLDNVHNIRRSKVIENRSFLGLAFSLLLS